MMRRVVLSLLAALVLACPAYAAGEKVYRLVAGELTEIPAREAGHRYRMALGPDGAPAYIEFTAAEETARDAEAALPPPPFSGLGRVIAQRANQVIPNNAGTAIDYTNEVRDIGAYHDNVTNPDRITIGAAQAGVFDIRAGVRFNEAGAAGGCTANTGDRVVQIRAGGSAVATMRVRAATTGDTELVIPASDQELVAGDVIRVFVLQTCGGTLPVDSRVSVRRLSE